jgi:hypothetical protein
MCTYVLKTLICSMKHGAQLFNAKYTHVKCCNYKNRLWYFCALYIDYVFNIDHYVQHLVCWPQTPTNQENWKHSQIGRIGINTSQQIGNAHKSIFDLHNFHGLFVLILLTQNSGKYNLLSTNMCCIY